MLDGLCLYGRYAAVSVRGQMQYRASFIMQSVGQFLVNIIEFMGIWVLFNRFDSLAGWSLAEVGFLYGLVNTAWAVTDMVSRGFDVFGSTVKNGEFDRILLRPRSTVLQLAGHELTMRRIGRILQGVVVLGWAIAVLDIDWSVAKVFLLVAAMAGCSALFYGLLVLQATVCFWTTESLEIMNVFTYGGVESARYPMIIYPRWFVRLFTFVIPLAAATYFPTIAILGRPDLLGFPVWFHWTSPILGFVFFAVTLQIWKLGVRHYRSTGS
jgi:ABC-2 type transport system permease protein